MRLSTFHSLCQINPIFSSDLFTHLHAGDLDFIGTAKPCAPQTGFRPSAAPSQLAISALWVAMQVVRLRICTQVAWRNSPLTDVSGRRLH